ncbi:MAG TPA: ion transporter [Bacteroidales bacterium]|nr:ion transporter [Bacteroidales bacterium]
MNIFRKRLYTIIFESDTKAGKTFDVVLLATILVSILLVMLDSVVSIHRKYFNLLGTLEWIITVIFTIEYIARIWVVERPRKYIFSIYGLIDILAILPSYLGLFFGVGQSLLVIRILRFLRIFRIFKLSRYTRAGRLLASSLWSNKEKILVFIVFVFTMATIIGTMMYLIEGEDSGFTDIPTSIYWAIVTLTTVGYGDISPVTGFGQFLASFVMILGYSMLAVPAGLVTASFITTKEVRNSQVCRNCLYDMHDDDAQYCKKCGTSLDKGGDRRR